MAKENPNTAVDPKLLAEIQSNISKVSNVDMLLFSQCLSALYWGGDWALISEGSEAYEQMKTAMPIIHSNPKYVQNDVVTAAPIHGGVLLKCKAQWFLQNVIGVLAPTYFNAHNAEFIARVQEVAQNETGRFAKYWEKTIAGKTDMFKQKDADGKERITGLIGVYNVNVNNSMTINGINYPAFKLPVEVVLNIMAQSAQANRIYVMTHNGDNIKPTWVPLQAVMQRRLYAQTLEFPSYNPTGLVLRIAVK